MRGQSYHTIWSVILFGWLMVYTILAETAPKRGYGTAFGFVNTPSFIGAIIAPWLTGWIRNVTGTFTWSHYTAVIFLAAGSIITLTVSNM